MATEITPEDCARLELIRDHDGNDLSENDKALLTRLIEDSATLPSEGEAGECETCEGERARREGAELAGKAMGDAFASYKARLRAWCEAELDPERAEIKAGYRSDAIHDFLAILDSPPVGVAESCDNCPGRVRLGPFDDWPRCRYPDCTGKNPQPEAEEAKRDFELYGEGSGPGIAPDGESAPSHDRDKCPHVDMEEVGDGRLRCIRCDHHEPDPFDYRNRQPDCGTGKNPSTEPSETEVDHG